MHWLYVQDRRKKFRKGFCDLINISYAAHLVGLSILMQLYNAYDRQMQESVTVDASCVGSS